jgi:methylmalonyl-CoA/ethylmalonyl-CoA epimerase
VVTVGELAQISFVVPDLDHAMAQWLSAGRAGPFFVLRHLDDLPVVHRGLEAPLDISVAFAQMGQVHVELVQQHNDGPSVFRDLYEPGESGLHHLCTLVPDVEAAAEDYVDQGFEIAMELQYGGTPMVYVDTVRAIGCMTELIRADADMVALYERFAAAAVDWDGTDPIRDM